MDIRSQNILTQDLKLYLARTFFFLFRITRKTKFLLNLVHQSISKKLSHSHRERWGERGTVTAREGERVRKNEREDEKQ